MEQDLTELQYNASVARQLHREALRRAAQQENATSGPGLEGVLARISAEATAEAAERLADHVTVGPSDEKAISDAINVQIGPPALKGDRGKGG